MNNNIQTKLPCPVCGSANTIKAGKNYQTKRQKMLCKDCGHLFQDGKIGDRETIQEKELKGVIPYEQ